MKDNLAKRLIFISRVIVGVLVIMIPVFLLKQEENNLRLDVESFSIISKVNSIRSEEFESNPFNKRILLWLQKEHKDLYDTHMGLRQTITTWLLEKQLTTHSELGTIKNDDKGAGFTLLSYELTDSDRQILSDLPSYDSSVKAQLAHFNILSVPRSLRIATRLTNNLPNTSEFAELPQGQIGRLYLEGNEAILQFSSALQGPSDIRLTVVTQNVDAPAILTFAQENAASAAGMIATVNSDRQRLDTVYANVPLYLAAQIASERLVSLYSTVDILGFSLARENLPWGILIIMITLLGASFITLRKALSHSLKIVSDVVSEDAFDILLDSMIGRVAIWIIVPLLAIAASLPSSPFTEMEIILLIVGGLLSLLLGYRCILLSNKL